MQAKRNCSLVCVEESHFKQSHPLPITPLLLRLEEKTSKFAISLETTYRKSKCSVSFLASTLLSTQLMVVTVRNFQMPLYLYTGYLSTSNFKNKDAITSFSSIRKRRKDFMGNKSWSKDLKIKLKLLKFQGEIYQTTMRQKRIT